MVTNVGKNEQDTIAANKKKISILILLPLQRYSLQSDNGGRVQGIKLLFYMTVT